MSIEAEIKKELEGLVSFVVVLGDRRKYLSCLLTLAVEPDPETMLPTNVLAPSARAWVDRVLGESGARTVAELLQCRGLPKLEAEIGQAIQRANGRATSNAAK